MIQAPSQCSQEITSREGPETNPIYCQITENFDTMVHPEVRSGSLGQFMKTSGPQIPSPPKRGGGTSHSQLGKWLKAFSSGEINQSCSGLKTPGQPSRVEDTSPPHSPKQSSQKELKSSHCLIGRQSGIRRQLRKASNRKEVSRWLKRKFENLQPVKGEENEVNILMVTYESELTNKAIFRKLRALGNFKWWQNLKTQQRTPMVNN